MNDLIRDERSFPLDSTTKAEVELEILSGPLRVRGGAAELCAALFEYSHEELRPLSEHAQEGEQARLEIRQPSTERLDGDVQNRWDVALNSDTGIALGVASMSGGVILELDDVNVTEVDVESKSGSVGLRLGGSYPDLDEVSVDSASGTIDVDLGGRFPALQRVDIESMSGRTRLAVTGECPELQRIAIDSKSGAVDLDLSGSFARDDLGVRVDSTSGTVSVVVPADVGVSMQATVVSGRIQADGFTSSDGRLVNGALGSSSATIWLNIHAVSGSIRVLTR